MADLNLPPTVPFSTCTEKQCHLSARAIQAPPVPLNRCLAPSPFNSLISCITTYHHLLYFFVYIIIFILGCVIVLILFINTSGSLFISLFINFVHSFIIIIFIKIIFKLITLFRMHILLLFN